MGACCSKRKRSKTSVLNWNDLQCRKDIDVSDAEKKIVKTVFTDIHNNPRLEYSITMAAFQSLFTTYPIAKSFFYSKTLESDLKSMSSMYEIQNTFPSATKKPLQTHMRDIAGAISNLGINVYREEEFLKEMKRLSIFHKRFKQMNKAFYRQFLKAFIQAIGKEICKHGNRNADKKVLAVQTFLQRVYVHITAGMPEFYLPTHGSWQSVIEHETISIKTFEGDQDRRSIGKAFNLLLHSGPNSRRSTKKLQRRGGADEKGKVVSPVGSPIKDKRASLHTNAAGRTIYTTDLKS